MTLSTLDGCCHFFGALWMVAFISWCTLGGCFYYLVHYGWFFLFRGSLWMVAFISWCTHDGSRYFLVHFGCLLSFRGALWIVPGPSAHFSQVRPRSTTWCIFKLQILPSSATFTRTRGKPKLRCLHLLQLQRLHLR